MHHDPSFPVLEWISSMDKFVYESYETTEDLYDCMGEQVRSQYTLILSKNISPNKSVSSVSRLGLGLGV